MPSRNVSLTEELDAAVQRRVDSGEYENASEVVRAAIRALERKDREEEAKLRWLNRTLKASEASGIAEDFTFDELHDLIDTER